MTEPVNFIRKSLQDMYPAGEIRNFTNRILEHVCGWQPYQFLAYDLYPTDRQLEEIARITERLRLREPVHYITGNASFCGLTFSVTPSTLIPRPETEELVELVAKDFRGRSADILDIGTGSGCIAVALAKMLPGSRVTAMDISAPALKVAEENGRLNNVNVSFIQADILSPSACEIPGRFDVIVSNPPYIKESERAGMDKNVVDYEPALALFVPDDDPFVFYRSIVSFASGKLRENGYIYFEINSLYGEDLCKALSKDCRSVELITDLSGHKRLIKTQL